MDSPASIDIQIIDNSGVYLLFYAMRNGGAMPQYKIPSRELLNQILNQLGVTQLGVTKEEIDNALMKNISIHRETMDPQRLEMVLKPYTVTG